MKIVIGHMFYDLLNLYGESGNVLAISRALKSQDVEVEERLLSIDNENWNLEDIDFLYMGTGTDNNQKIALEVLKKHKEELKDYIDAGKFFLATGNSIEIFGKSIIEDEKKEEALGLFDYETKRTNRRVSECRFKHKDIEEDILGFENNHGETINNNTYLFSVLKGYGSKKDEKEEGFSYKNFYATYLIGPVLARNPEVLEKLCRKIISSKEKDFEFKTFDFEIEKEAHRRYLEKYETN